MNMNSPNAAGVTLGWYVLQVRKIGFLAWQSMQAGAIAEIIAAWEAYAPAELDPRMVAAIARAKGAK